MVVFSASKLVRVEVVAATIHTWEVKILYFGISVEYMV
jgi:hypothetical protein